MKHEIAGFQWDGGNWPKCASHGVSRAEIEAVFDSDPAIMDDPFPAEPRKRAIGPVGGRYIFLVFVFRKREEGVFIRPVSARYMHKREIDHYESSIA